MRPNIPAVALRVWHPSMKPGAIAQHLAMSPKFSWEVGMQRRTPKGRVLQGTNRNTYCCFELPKSKIRSDEWLERVIEGTLSGHKRLFRRIVATGGEVELYVTWKTGSNAGDTFSWSALRGLADLRVNLSVEWFP